jgi:hypothetical protein
VRGGVQVVVSEACAQSGRAQLLSPWHAQPQRTRHPTAPYRTPAAGAHAHTHLLGGVCEGQLLRLRKPRADDAPGRVRLLGQRHIDAVEAPQLARDARHERRAAHVGGRQAHAVQPLLDAAVGKERQHLSGSVCVCVCVLCVCVGGGGGKGHALHVTTTCGKPTDASARTPLQRLMHATVDHASRPPPPHTHLRSKALAAERDDDHLLRCAVDELLRLVTKHLEHDGLQAQRRGGRELGVNVGDAPADG